MSERVHSAPSERQISTSTFPGEYIVECEAGGCDFFRDTGNRDADRMAGRRHAADTGHKVRAQSARITYFETQRSDS